MADGSLVVFDRSTASLETLGELTAGDTAMGKVVEAWLAAPAVAFLLLGSTGGAAPRAFSLGARDEAHLAASVLPDAATLIDPAALPRSTCTAVDGDLHSLVTKLWSDIIAPRS